MKEKKNHSIENQVELNEEKLEGVSGGLDSNAGNELKRRKVIIKREEGRIHRPGNMEELAQSVCDGEGS